jgi:hypothetical protein
MSWYVLVRIWEMQGLARNGKMGPFSSDLSGVGRGSRRDSSLNFVGVLNAKKALRSGWFKPEYGGSEKGGETRTGPTSKVYGWFHRGAGGR